MGKIKGAISWVLLLIVVVVGLIIGRSIWFSLQDTRAELKAQKDKVAELTKRDSSMKTYVDSLNKAILNMQAEEQQLQKEREQLQNKLVQTQIKYNKVLARIDTLWQANSIIKEMDEAFPHWQGQFWQASRGDGIHGIIAPRFFGAEVVEIKAKLDKSQKEIILKDSMNANLTSTLSVKNEEMNALTLKADTLSKTYNNLWGEYQALDKKYTVLLRKKWWTLHLSMDNLITGGVGLAAGYWLGKR